MNLVAARSYERLTKADLRRIRDLALARLYRNFTWMPDGILSRGSSQ